jgi:hypothetical protein
MPYYSSGGRIIEAGDNFRHSCLEMESFGSFVAMYQLLFRLRDYYYIVLTEGEQGVQL